MFQVRLEAFDAALRTPKASLRAVLPGMAVYQQASAAG